MAEPGIVYEVHNASEIVARQVGRGRADATAIVAQDAVLTYEQLRQAVNRAGWLLRTLGVGREERVLLALDDTSVFPIVFLGAMRIGAVPVPVSPTSRDEYFEHFIDDCYARVIVADPEIHERLERAVDGRAVQFLVRGVANGKTIDLDEGLEAQASELDAVPTHQDDMAFLLYSSGSTGMPKGVVHRHQDIGVSCENFGGGVLGLTPDDVTYSTSKQFHAYGLDNGLTLPLWFGATSVLVPGAPKPEPVIGALRTHKPSVFFSVPTIYRVLLGSPAAEGALQSVRLCVSAAEPLPATTWEQWRDRFGIDILDGIGSTEMLIAYCSNRPGKVRPGTSGWPVPGYDLRLVDEDDNVLDGPAVGSLQVRGESCAASYWHQRGMTQRAMRGDWFVTGDRFARRSDGSYEFIGRDDDMLKVDGLWVSPTDVEQVLTAHPRVAGAGVVGRSLGGMTRLVAYIKPVGGEQDRRLVAELQAWCGDRLAPHRRPAFMVFVDELPTTQSGKLQRFRLRELESNGRTPDELVSAIGRTWSHVLGTTVSVTDNFFALGGDSLSAAELILALQDELGYEVKATDLLLAPTVEGLANLIAHGKEQHEGAPLPAGPVPITSSGPEAPRLYFVPPLGGSVFQLRPLADALSDDVAIHGIPAWERVPAAATVEEEARHLADGLQSVQPSGPYWLGGHSGGGLVAWEMARVLEERGAEVAGVVMLDSLFGERHPAPEVPRASFPDLRGRPAGQKLSAYIRGIREPDLVMEMLWSRLGVARNIERAIWWFDLRRKGEVRPSQLYAYLWAGTARALEQYAPGPCRAPAFLIRAVDRPDPVLDEKWAALAEGGLSVRVVEVPHDELLDKSHAEPIAAQIRAMCAFGSDLPSGRAHTDERRG